MVDHLYFELDISHYSIAKACVTLELEIG